MLKNLKSSNVFLLVCLIANVATVPVLMATTRTNQKPIYTLSEDEREFVFAGLCPNGGAYRMLSYEMEIDGLTQAFYDYEGPAGKGTVRTNAQPKKMLTRVCRNFADINDGSKFD